MKKVKPAPASRKPVSKSAARIKAKPTKPSKPAFRKPKSLQKQAAKASIIASTKNQKAIKVRKTEKAEKPSKKAAAVVVAAPSPSNFTSKATLPVRAPSRPVVVIPPRNIPPKPVVDSANRDNSLIGLKPILPPAAKQEVILKVDSVIPPEKDLSTKGDKVGQIIKDRMVLMVPDPHWLHAHWEISHQSVQRAEAALGQDWHGSKPIIRIFDVTSLDTTSTSETPIRDIAVHGGCNHWYIDIPQPPRSYRVDVGYLSRRGQFFVLARSNVVLPPKIGVAEPVEENWKDDLEDDIEEGEENTREKASEKEEEAKEKGKGKDKDKDKNDHLDEMIDDNFRRPMKDQPLGTPPAVPVKLKKFSFELDAELFVYGKTDPNANVTLQNEPIKLRPDGTFTMRYSLPDSRQIIPAVATTQDGMEELTIVLAVERNTKHLDPQQHELFGSEQ